MKNQFKLLLLLPILSASTTTLLAQPANAVIYDWQFTSKDGLLTLPTDVVAGFVEFAATDFGDLENATNVPAIDLQITSVTSVNNSFSGNGGIELNTPLLNVPSDVTGNDWNFDSEAMVQDFFNITVNKQDDSDTSETLNVGTNLSSFSGSFGSFLDNNSSTLTFTQQASASVPFEFSPALGLLAVGGFLAGSRFLKRRQTLVK